MKRALFLAAGLIAISSPAYAVSVTWKLQDWNFSDGATASGSFDYDADTGEISNVDITTTASLAEDVFVAGANPDDLPLFQNPSFGGARYTVESGINEDPTKFRFVPANLDNFLLSPLLAVNLSRALTNAGGIIPIDASERSIEGLCIAPDCSTAEPLRFAFGGASIVAGVQPTPVPLPAGGTLMLIGLAALGFARRK